MTTLPTLLPPSLIAKIVFVLGLVGLTDASYLTAKFFFGGPIPCSVLSGCDTVTKSAYATIAQVPIALLGALFYLTFLILIVYYWDTGDTKVWTWLFGLSTLGFVFSVYLVALQIFIIKALCLYCLISAATSTGLFCLCFWAWKNS